VVAIITHTNSGVDQVCLDELFCLRHRVFVEGRGWSLPSRRDREVDQYDDRRAVYFVDRGPGGAIEASVRLTPTLHSSLLADYFPHLVENGVSPRGERIFEATRYIVQPRERSRQANRAAKARLLGAMLEWALEQDLDFIQTVIDAATLRSFVEMTMHTMPLGLAHPYGGGRGVRGGGECLAIRWPVTAEVLADIRAYGLVPGHRSDADGHHSILH